MRDDLRDATPEVPEPVRILRTADLVDLRVRFHGLVFERPSTRRVLVRADPAGEAWIVVEFPAQHVLERAFFESAGEGFPDPPAVGSEPRPGPPVESRIGGRSRLVFSVGPGDEVPYTAEGLLVAVGRLPMRLVGDAGPENPFRDLEGDPRTGVELPFRLLLSPPPSARWSHRSQAADTAGAKRVELWHTCIRDTTAQAVWTRDFPPEGPTREVPPGPFNASLTSRHRANFVYLTSHRGLFTDPAKTHPYVPVPVAVENLMLSTLGGWLDSLGQWEPRPFDISVREWRHRAAMGRDHYARVMCAGFLAPFGHPATLVQVTERRFDPNRPDHTAYLIQRLFITVREPVCEFAPATVRKAADGRLLNVLFPFTRVELLTTVTPNLKPPDNHAPDGHGEDEYVFFPGTDTEDPFEFKVRATDLAGRTVEFKTPLLFLSEQFNQGADLAKVLAYYTNLVAPKPSFPDLPVELSAELGGQRIAMAPGKEPDDTTVEVTYLVWGAETPTDTDPQTYQKVAGFLPTLRWSWARVPTVSGLSGNNKAVPVRYPARYAKAAFPGMFAPPSGSAESVDAVVNTGEVYLELPQPLEMAYKEQRGRSGGLVTPDMSVTGLSRLTGPVAGALEEVADGGFNPAEFFKQLDARLFGVLPLELLVSAAGLNEALKVPKFISQTVNAATGFLVDLRRLQQQLEHVQERFPAVRAKVREVRDTALALVREIEAYVSGPGTLHQVEAAFTAFSAALDDLGAGLPRAVDQAVHTLLKRVREVAATWDSGVAGVLSLKQSIMALEARVKLPETVSTRLEWSPDIKPCGLTEGAPPIFVPHTAPPGEPERKGRFSLVVDARGSVRPDVRSGVDITCTLEEFSLCLVPGFDAMELDFQRIRFTARAGQKLDTEILFRSLRFRGVLEFVEALRRIIPVDGFSDPPRLEVTPAGLHARYALPLPNVGIGVFSLENIALDAYLSLPFISTGGLGKSLEIGFAFCSRQAPFRLTVSCFGGGGHFGVVLTPEGLSALDMALEFGAATSLNFGVASGSVSVMAGIYLRYELVMKQTTMLGYFRARGEVDVLGLVSASIELYLAIGYQEGQAVGRASLTISIEIGFFSKSVTISCEKRFAGSAPGFTLGAGAPTPATFHIVMSPYTDPVTGVRRDPIYEYCTAFAEVR